MYTVSLLKNKYIEKVGGLKICGFGVWVISKSRKCGDRTTYLYDKKRKNRHEFERRDGLYFSLDREMDVQYKLWVRNESLRVFKKEKVKKVKETLPMEMNQLPHVNPLNHWAIFLGCVKGIQNVIRRGTKRILSYIYSYFSANLLLPLIQPNLLILIETLYNITFWIK